MSCDYCQKHKKLLECSFKGISLDINIINKTQLDAMAKVKYHNGRITSVGQSNTIRYCPMCGRKL